MVRNQEKQGYIQKRLDAYMELLKSGKVAEISLEIENAKDIVRFLDMALILMEGGTEEDFKLLDSKSSNAEAGEKSDGDEASQDEEAPVAKTEV